MRRLAELFPDENIRYALDPEYEPHDEKGNLPSTANLEKFAIAMLFKEYRDAGLLMPTHPNEQLYQTALKGHTAELTARGREFWWLVKNKRL